MDKDMKPLPPPSVQTRLEVTELMKVIRSYVYVLLPRWSTQEKELGTAVMLRAGNHLFAVTAEHCARQGMTLLFPLGEGQKARSQILTAHTCQPLDVAVLELEDRSDVLACDIEQLCVELPKPASKDSDPATEPLFWAVGYPALLARATDDALSVHQVAFGTNLVDVKPEELTLYYHEEAYGIGHNLTCELNRLPETPHGFSGAGVWGLHRPEEGALFSPQRHVRLYGVQHSWLDVTRRLKCVPSRVIAKILSENYPDLKDRLTTLFVPVAVHK